MSFLMNTFLHKLSMLNIFNCICKLNIVTCITRLKSSNPALCVKSRAGDLSNREINVYLHIKFEILKASWKFDRFYELVKTSFQSKTKYLKITMPGYFSKFIQYFHCCANSLTTNRNCLSSFTSHVFVHFKAHF